MTILPNWVDLVVVSLIFINGYIGLGRGLFTELLNLAGAITATVIAVNYARLVIDPLQQVLHSNSVLASFVVFWGFFLIVVILVHMVTRRLAHLLKWEPFHWFLRGLGLLLGGARGVWWAGVLLMAMNASGMLYLQESIQDRSVIGPHLLSVSRERLDAFSNFIPGRKFGEGSPFPSAVTL